MPWLLFSSANPMKKTSLRRQQLIAIKKNITLFLLNFYLLILPN